MRYGPDDKFWVVIDPNDNCELEDTIFQASLRDLDLQFKGGMQIEKNPTLFTDEQEARYETFGEDGNLVFEADLPHDEK